ncbi:Hypothetical protein FKW44_002330 [Caligus rogercresseyi]|uniref:Uncharacterized protein n=1 Tax=Caligus rogercresseyi TaxID=217165 RepID=A0A7T8QW94_CALRO|nr:Hypothetical protein FKW44_002330 [Caligus rogercresseyi]
MKLSKGTLNNPCRRTFADGGACWIMLNRRRLSNATSGFSSSKAIRNAASAVMGSRNPVFYDSINLSTRA